MTAKLTAADVERIRRQGIAPLSAEQGLKLLDEAIAQGGRSPQCVPAKLELSARGTEAPPDLLRKLVKAAAVPLRVASSARTPTEDALRRQLAGLDPAEQGARLVDLVRSEASAVLRLPMEDVADDQPLKSFGLDSLMAVELCDRLRTNLQMSLPATLAFDHPTVGDIARFVTTLLPRGDGEVPVHGGDVLRRRDLLDGLFEPAKGQRPAVDKAGAIDELSNEELVRLVKTL
jgi:acyl carrier protein